MGLFKRISHFFIVATFSLVALIAVLFTTNTLFLLTRFISFQHDFEYNTHFKHQDQDFLAGTGKEDGVKEEWMTSLGTDFVLLVCFILQHSLMAHNMWKSLLDAVHLGVIGRAFYVICTSATLAAVMSYWRCTTSLMVWSINTEDSALLWLLFIMVHVVGWTLVVGATLLMDAYELMGLKQVYYYSMGLQAPIAMKSYGLRRLYTHMRHPGACALTAMLLIHPHMTASRALLAVVMSLYTLSRFRVDKEDHSYMQQQMASKEDELATVISTSYQQEQLSVRQVWQQSFYQIQSPKYSKEE